MKKKAPLTSDKADAEIYALFGLSDDKPFLQLMKERKKRGYWEFRSIASNLRISLGGTPDIVTPQGRTIPGKSFKAQFLENNYPTEDWTTARDLYLSNAYERGRIWDSLEKEEEVREKTFNDFLKTVKSDPERLKKLKAALVDEEEDFV
jgi:hypothetical protein